MRIAIPIAIGKSVRDGNARQRVEQQLIGD